MTMRNSRNKRQPPQARRAERNYSAQLRKLAKQVGKIIGGFDTSDASTIPTLEEMMQRYAESLMPWAISTASKMLDEVNQRDLLNWKASSEEMSVALRQEIMHAPIGRLMQKLLDEQVSLIRSIPIEAAKRVHDLTLKGITEGTRAKNIAAEIMRSGEVAQSRAMTIARTEVSRTQALLTEARAQSAGITQYQWMTAQDGTVRPEHKALNGKVFSWNDPPIADHRSGARANPGCIYNCRCWPRPIFTN